MPATHATQPATRRWRTALRTALTLGAVLVLLASTAAVAQTGPAIIHVDASAGGANDGSNWSDAYTALQDAFDEVNANPGTDYQIWIASGVYYPDEGGGHLDNELTESFTLARDGVEIYGGFVGGEGTLAERDVSGNAPVVLSGDIDHDSGGADVTNANGVTQNAAVDIQGSNGFHVLVFDGSSSANITAATVLDGVTVTAGDADGRGWRQNGGGGLLCRGDGNVCSPVIANATFSGNYAGDFGGAIYNYVFNSGSSSPRITNAVFSGNRAAVGGAIYNRGADGTSSPTITNTIFFGNRATVGGAMENSGYNGISSPTITNAIFVGNHANASGGALYNESGSGGTSSPNITNATFVGNHADISGGAIKNYSSGGTSSPSLNNVVLYGNTADSHGAEIVNDEASVTVSDSLIQGGCPDGDPSWTCTAVIDDAPLFVDASNPAGADGQFATGDDGLRLSLASPARDRGNDALPGDSADLDGDGNTSEALPLDIVGADRIRGNHVDLGAYEAGAAYTIGGTLSGLASGSSVALQNNGGDDLTMATNGPFAFAMRVPDGDSYEVAVATEPTGPNQTCTVANASGNVSGANVTTVEVTCETDAYTIGGAVSGLGSGTRVVLTDDESGQTVTVPEDGSFTFPTAVPDGSGYTVTVADQPEGQACTVADGSGTVSGGDVNDVQVACAVNTYAVTASAGANGTVTPGDRTVAHGATAAFTVIPDEGYSAVPGGDCPAGALAGETYTTGAITGTCAVNVTFTEGSARTLELIGGDGQSAAPGGAFGTPLVVQVRDGEGKPLAGVAVTFTVTGGGAGLAERPLRTGAASGLGLISTTVAQSAGTTSVAVTTDADGRAEVYAAASESAGPVTVTAEAAGVDDPVRFALTVTVAGATAVPAINLPGLLVMALLLLALGQWMTRLQRR